MAFAPQYREGKVTLPVILAYARADEESRRFWGRAIETGPQEMREVLADIAGFCVERAY